MIQQIFTLLLLFFLSLCLFVAFSYMFVGFCLAYSGSFFNFILWAGMGRVLNKKMSDWEGTQ